MGDSIYSLPVDPNDQPMYMNNDKVLPYLFGTTDTSTTPPTTLSSLKSRFSSLSNDQNSSLILLALISVLVAAIVYFKQYGTLATRVSAITLLGCISMLIFNQSNLYNIIKALIAAAGVYYVILKSTSTTTATPTVTMAPSVLSS
jgi:hypothetical protein